MVNSTVQSYYSFVRCESSLLLRIRAARMSETTTSVITRKLFHNLETRVKSAIESQLCNSCAFFKDKPSVIVILYDNTDISFIPRIYLAVNNVSIEAHNFSLREPPRYDAENTLPHLSSTIAFHTFSREAASWLNFRFYAKRQVQ